MNMMSDQSVVVGSSSELMNDDGAYLGPSVRCVLFRLQKEVYGIQVKKIREVLKVGTIRQVPGSDAQVLGVINVRGVIVTVIDARRTLGLAPKPIDQHSRIIIVEIDAEHTLGFLVDFVMEVKDIPEQKFEPMVSVKDTASRYIQGIAHFQDQVIILIDVESLFAASDIEFSDELL
ncbi:MULTISPECIES: chemotaxis protein CheW [Thiomicrorhabdus]|uniref:Chemotaxis protein CheW n=1 Tax=Thiomicrorhabdus heinhorstiae TaxID=2748010 RepID=A0ABS0BX25_9GAMM|nr:MULTISPECIES: chemotaxis protein CheW [Thiomicrorhabdus]MBF6058357.1 chemotaxis protein CheW [Thiomicrorhabdus heinhorstiae]